MRFDMGRRRAGSVLAGSLISTALLLGTALPADAAPVTGGEKTIAKRLKARFPGALGNRSSGIVLDAASGRVIWSKKSKIERMPGSTAKLVTALTAMDRLGPDYTVTTRITTGASASQIVLVGAGDQLLDSSAVASMAARTANKLLAAGIESVSIKVDDSLFPEPTMAKGWKSTYYPYEVSPVRALVVDQRAKMDTSIDAGQILAGHLEQDGVDVTSVSRGLAPEGATTLASHTSPPMKDWLKRMLLVSDADIAEGIARLVAMRHGRTATWTNARIVRNAVLEKYRVPGVTMYDGSGLSLSDRVTAKGMARLVRVLNARPALQEVISYLPVSGKTGTLAASSGRFSTKPSICAKGRIRAKTGSLGDMIALAGVARNPKGTERIFVFLETGKAPSTKVKRSIDGFAATTTGCW